MCIDKDGILTVTGSAEGTDIKQVCAHTYLQYIHTYNAVTIRHKHTELLCMHGNAYIHTLKNAVTIRRKCTELLRMHGTYIHKSMH